MSETKDLNLSSLDVNILQICNVDLLSLTIVSPFQVWGKFSITLRIRSSWISKSTDMCKKYCGSLFLCILTEPGACSLTVGDLCLRVLHWHWLHHSAFLYRSSVMSVFQALHQMRSESKTEFIPIIIMVITIIIALVSKPGDSFDWSWLTLSYLWFDESHVLPAHPSLVFIERNPSCCWVWTKFCKHSLWFQECLSLNSETAPLCVVW